MRLQSFVAIALAVTAWAACSSSYETSEAPRGGNNQACFENGTCFDGLLCIAGRCIAESALRDGAASASSSSSGSGSSSSSSSSSGGSSPASYDALFGTVCERASRCNPGLYADVASCVAQSKVDLAANAVLTGLGTLSQTEVDACTEKQKTFKTCDGIAFFPECAAPGTLANGAPCANGGQCIGAACARANATDKCGKCTAAVTAGGDCDAFTKVCAPGLYCLSNKCVPLFAKGASCTASNGFFCALETKCVNGKCDAPAKEGDDCPGFTECAGPLACDPATKKCFRRAVRKVGDACDVAKQDICEVSRCDSTKNKCVPFAPKDGACTLAGFECDLTKHACIDNTCQPKPGPATCP